MEQFFPFFIILVVGLLFSEVFNRMHLPWVSALIIAGMAVGPFGFDVIDPTPTLELMSEIGLVFLMFMAGLELRIGSMRDEWRHIKPLALLGTTLPFAVGYGIGYLFGFDSVTSLLIGIIFTSSSVAVVIPSLEASGMLSTRVGKSIIASTVFHDVLSLVALSILLQSVNPITPLPLPLFYVLLFGFLILLRWGIGKMRQFFAYSERHISDRFQQELRAIFVILIGTAVIFEIMGLHSMIAGFFAGAVLSDSIHSDTLKEKLRAFSYGLFIPVFFIMVGVNTDISVFSGDANGALLLTIVIVIGSIVSKIVSGWYGGKLSGFSNKQSSIIAVSHIPQLSTALAVVFAGYDTGLLPPPLVTAMVILSITTTFSAPIFMKMLAKTYLFDHYTMRKQRAQQTIQ